MGNLSNLYISQSFVSLIHLGSDSSITTQSVELQDGLGNGLGIFVNALGDVVIEGQISASNIPAQITSLPQFNAYTASTNTRLNNIESTTASLNASVTQLNASSASQQVSINSLNNYTASFSTASIATSITELNSFSASAKVSISALNTYTASQSTASIVTSITNLNTFTSSANVRLNNLETTTASLLVETANLELFSASALSSLSQLNASSASQQVSINAINAITNSLVTEAESGSFLITASFNNGTRNLTFTKGDNTTFNVNIPDVSGSIVATGSLLVTASAVDNVITFTKGDGTTFPVTVTLSGSQAAIPQGTVSSSAQITALGFVSSSVTASSLITASFNNGTRNLTFTKGDNTTFAVNIPDVSGSSGDFVTTSSFNAYTSSTNTRLSNIELTTASLFTSTSLSLTSASVSGQLLSFTKGNNSTFTVTLPSGSQSIVTGSYGAFQDSTTQSGSANTAYKFKFNTTDISDGVILSGSTGLRVGAYGTYNLEWSGQAVQGSGAAIVSIWVNVNGIQVSGSRGDVTLPSNTKLLPAWNYFLTLNPLDVVELLWASDSGNTTWQALPIGTTPTSPSAASIIATLARVDVGGGTNVVTTGSFNAYTSSTNVRLNNLELTTASLNTSITNLNASSASQQVSINSLNAKSGSYLTTGSASGSQRALGAFNFDMMYTSSFNQSAVTSSAGYVYFDYSIFNQPQMTFWTTSDGQVFVNAGTVFINGSGVAIQPITLNFDYQSYGVGIPVTGSGVNGATYTLTGPYYHDLTVTGSITSTYQQQVIGLDGRKTVQDANGIYGITANGAVQSGVSVDSGIYAGNNTNGNYVGLAATASQVSSQNGNTPFDTPQIWASQNSLGSFTQISFQGNNNYTDGTITVHQPLFVSASLNVTGSFTASLANGFAWVGNSSNRAVAVATSSFAGSGGAGFPFTGSAVITGSLAVTGSVRGFTNTLTVAASTASINMNDGNFFRLTLPTGSTTHVTVSNLSAGQTINLLVSQSLAATGSIAFAPNIRFAGGIDYTATAITGAMDIVSFVSFDTNQIFATQVKNLS